MSRVRIPSPAPVQPGFPRQPPGISMAHPAPVTISSMQGNPKVIAALNEALKEELTAISQYFLHAEMCENWHYDKLGDFIRKQSIDEIKHAESLVERILFLEGPPTL